MNDDEKARRYLEIMYESRAKNFVDKVDAKTRGLQMILFFLCKHTGEVCAGDLSKAFCVSSARIAAAIKNLSQKGLIETCTSDSDGRKVVVKITDAGRDEVQKSIDEMVKLIKFLMQRIGEDDLKEFLRIFAKINAVLDKI